VKCEFVNFIKIAIISWLK